MCDPKMVNNFVVEKVRKRTENDINLHEFLYIHNTFHFSLDRSFGNNLLQHHKNVLTELVNRDKNRPSVIAWSVANEPSSAKNEADKYFQYVIKYIRIVFHYVFISS